MALKKPGELFKKQTNASEGHSLPISGSLTNIKEQFNKVEELKKQLEGVTSSIDSSFVAVAGQRQLHQQHKASALLGRVSVSQALRL